MRRAAVCFAVLAPLLLPMTAAHATDLPCGVAQVGTCQSASEAWTFTLATGAGVYAGFVETATTPTGARARLYQSDCSTLAGSIDELSGDIDGSQLAAGDYCLVVTCPTIGAGYLVEYGAYDASGPLCDSTSLTCEATPTSGEINGVTSPPFEMFDSYSFVTEPGSMVTFTLADTGDPNFSPWVLVIGQNGEGLANIHGAGSHSMTLPGVPPCPVTYSLVVWNGQGTGNGHLEPGSYGIAVSGCSVGSCGNGAVCSGEECDDGNGAGGDGCSSQCEIEPGWTCSGQPSSCTAVCGDGLLVGEEACDLGPSGPDSGNCPADAAPPTCGACTRSCSSTCQLVGRCTGSAGCCLAASDCPPGEGCCGNGTVESGEACDDGNLLGGDTCTPQCVSDTGIPFTCCRPGSEVAGGTVLIGQKLKLNKLTAPAGDDKFTSPGETILLPGQDIHPCTEGVSYCLEGDDGIVYGPTPGDGFAISGNAFGPKPPCLDQSVPDRRVRAIFKDKTLLMSEPNGLSRVQIKNVRSQSNKYKFKVQGKNVDLSAATGATRLRQTLVVGDTCMTLNLTCVDKSGGKTKVCTPAP